MTVWPGRIGEGMRDGDTASVRVLSVGGLDFVADAAGALFLESEGLLLVADLHLEKGSAFAARGQMLPPYDSRTTLAALGRVIGLYNPALVCVLGDSLHDRGAMARMDAQDLSALRALQSGRDWIWLAGNHDPEPPRELGGSVFETICVAGVTLRHAPGMRAGDPEIAGHLHPAGKVRGRGRAVRRRCFVSDGRRCVMPAFGSYAGGLNVLDDAFAPLFPGRDFVAHMLGDGRVYAVSGRQLSPD